jgi:murein DD-endopeptidase MepM/ murein hydrolase activator NlpD
MRAPTFAALLLVSLASSALAAPRDVSGEYRLRSLTPATGIFSIGFDTTDAALTLTRRPDGRYTIVRTGDGARLEGIATATEEEGGVVRLDVSITAPGLAGAVSREAAKATGSYRVRAQVIRGQLKLTRGTRTRTHIDTGRARSPYLLPWRGGKAHLCVQGNCGVVSHFRGGWDQHSFDFAMPVGTSVLAARAGLVIDVDVSHHGAGKNKPANHIYVRHDDGTTASYVHLKQHGTLVKVGDSVRQGQAIGLSGNVGPSLLPHLHFMVAGRDGNSIPVWFDDLPAGRDGVPRMLRRYRSGNAR